MEQTSNPKTLVLGLGNPLSGDDGFGTQVLEFLQQKDVDLPVGVTLVNAHTDLLNHLDSFAEYDCIVLIDAILDPNHKLGNPGKIVKLHEVEWLSWSESSPSVHQMSPILAVQLFRQLYPAVRNHFILVGLLVDQITRAPHLATEERIQEAARVIRNFLL